LEDVDIPMARGTKRFRHVLTLALVAAGAGDAWATRLDKTACADLNTELATLLGSGLKEDMAKGPAWAAANLSPERLVSISRVVELQGQIEFRCGTPGRNVAKSPNAKPNDKAPVDKPGTAKAATAKSNGEDGDDAAAATKPAPKARTMRRKRGSAATSPDMPDVVPAAATPAAQPPHVTPPVTASAAATPGKPAPEPQKTAVTVPPAAAPPATTPPAAAPANPTPELGKTATTTPPAVPPSQAGKVTPVSATPQAATDAKKTTPVVPITAAAPVPGEAAATVPGAQKTAAKKKSSRRDSSSAYVSPTDVNPFSLITGN
jgi:hypothetical protein